MPYKFLQQGISLLLRRQTNILSAALIIMATVIFSQILGLIRQRLLVAIFGASNDLGVYLASAKLPDFLFQLVIAGALSSAFIPVFSEFLSKNEDQKAHTMASTLLTLGMVIFAALSIVLFIFANFFLQLMNVGAGFSSDQIELMAKLMRIIIFGQLLFIIGTFFSALLQSYNHFFIPGIAAALYNLGVIVAIIVLSPFVGIHAPAYGVILGATLFILAQIPMMHKVGFPFRPSFSLKAPGVQEVFSLMWPRTLSLAIFQLGTLAIVSLVSFLAQAGRNYVIFDYAQTLAFAPVGLFGQTIAQAAFPVLSRERKNLENFRAIFMTSFNQMLYLVLPISALLLILRIPVVRLVFGAGLFDWEATVRTGNTLAFFSLSIFAQALIYLVARGFYALHDTKTPLLIGAITTVLMIIIGAVFVLYYKLGVESIAGAYSIASLLHLFLSLVVLHKRIGGFSLEKLFLPMTKILVATFFTGFALYIPLKLLDQLVFDTTRTINLLALTGISSFAGLSLYLFLTWFFNVEEAKTFLLMFQKIGNWRSVLEESNEVVVDPTRSHP